MAHKLLPQSRRTSNNLFAVTLSVYCLPVLVPKLTSQSFWKDEFPFAMAKDYHYLFLPRGRVSVLDFSFCDSPLKLYESSLYQDFVSPLC